MQYDSAVAGTLSPRPQTLYRGLILGPTDRPPSLRPPSSASLSTAPGSATVRYLKICCKNMWEIFIESAMDIEQWQQGVTDRHPPFLHPFRSQTQNVENQGKICICWRTAPYPSPVWETCSPHFTLTGFNCLSKEESTPNSPPIMQQVPLTWRSLVLILIRIVRRSPLK